MEKPITSTSDAALVALARNAFQQYYASCFWYLDPGFKVELEHLSLIAEGLRRHGDRKAFQLAHEICP